MKTSALWDVRPCCLVDIYQDFEGTYFLYLQMYPEDEEDITFLVTNFMELNPS
jgi:hypothetical protein